MKKFFMAVVLLVSVLSFIGCTIHGKNDPIKLSFDQSTAYFASQVKLSPIVGEKPAAEDKTESARVTIYAENAGLVQLSAAYCPGQTKIEGLKISVDGAEKDFEDGVVLFEGSMDGKAERTFDIVIYLCKNAPITVAGKQLAFNFVLKAR